MQVKRFDQGVAFWQDKSRLTVMLLSPFYSFWPRYETRRAGCPIGLELIASELAAKGFNVIFIDACMSAYNQFIQQENGTIRYGLTDEQLERVLADFNPAVVGITSLFSNQAGNVERVARLVKRAYPNAIVTEGGSHASGDVNEVLKSPWVDMVIREEGLATFPELCQSIEAKASSRNFTFALGVSYKSKSGGAVHNGSRGFIPIFDVLAPRRLEIPLHPMYDTLEHTGGSRHRKNGRHAYILSSEGCPLKCDFCHIHIMAGNIRYYTLARFEQEVAQLKAAGVNEIVVEDDMFFADIPRAMAVGDILKKYDMAWFEEGGLSMFKFMKPGSGLTHEQMLDKLAETGCYRYYHAIESANPMSLTKSHKPHINSEQDAAEEIVRYTAKVGIEGVGGFMLGFKGNGGGFEESREDMERTVAYAKRLKQAGLAYVMLFIYTAIPGTNAYKYLKSVFPDLDLRTSHERSAFPVGGLTPAELTELRLQWMQEVNGSACMGIAEETKNWGL
ncbi:MAG: B12-binding domain-containing radical SAM protein [Parcubacteria group bacterium]|nr:B12-binding domain-containing radical SAM protein [Parcubacteria group bacterium]